MSKYDFRIKKLFRTAALPCLAASYFLTFTAAPAARKPKAAKTTPATKTVPVKPIYEQSFDEIIKNYLIVNDFSIKPQTRPLPKNKPLLQFWRYGFKIPPVSFPI